MYISMCGAGLGFAVEWENVQQFPQIKKQIKEKASTHVVVDSKEGWADAFVLGLKAWFDGKDVKFDYSMVRPAGARLETAGGRASGPQPLMDLMEFAKRKNGESPVEYILPESKIILEDTYGIMVYQEPCEVPPRERG